MNDKQTAFAHEYILDFNATQAAIRAGYAESSATQHARRLLTNRKVQSLITKLKLERLERTKVDADDVLRRLVEIDQMDIGDILEDNGSVKPIKDWPGPWRRYVSDMDISEIFDGRGDERAIAGLLKKIKWSDKLKNLELLGKHVDVSAFSERTDHRHLVC